MLREERLFVVHLWGQTGGPGTKDVANVINLYYYRLNNYLCLHSPSVVSVVGSLLGPSCSVPSPLVLNADTSTV